MWLLVFFNANAQSAPNPLPAAGLASPTSLRVQYLVDSTDGLTIEQVSSPQARWQTSEDPTLILGFTPHPVWCRFTLQQAADTSRDFALEITNYYVDSLTLYQPDSLKGWSVQHSGDMIPFARRTPATRFPAFYVTVSGTRPQTFYARILASQHHSYRWQIWNQAPFMTHRLPDIERYISFALLLMLALFPLGGLLFMYRFVVLRAYSLLGLAVAASAVVGTGLSNVIFPNSPYWAHTSHYVGVAIVMPVLAYYIVRVCKLPRYMPRVVVLYQFFGGIGLLYAGLSFFVRHPYITWAIVAALCIMHISIVLTLLALYRRRIQPAFWYIISIILTSPIYAYFYGRNAGFFIGLISEETLKYPLLFSTLATPLIWVGILWEATRDRIRTAENLSLEQSRRENIQALDKLKTDFFTNVSHELRTPLTLILGPLGSVLKRQRTDGEDTRLIETAQRSARQLLKLVNEILDLSKLEAGKVAVSLRPVRLVEVARLAVANFESQAQLRNIALELNYEVEELLVLALDVKKIRHVLENLLSNAIKATPAGGTITLGVQVSPDKLLLRVSDTGRGIHPDDLPHVFDRFFQTNQPDAAVEGGTGIGLALCQEYARAMQGRLWVESQWGQGTTFFLELPLLVAPAGTEASASDPEEDMAYVPRVPAEPPVSTSGETVLVVEDNPSLRNYLLTVLQPRFKVWLAEDGQAALDLLAQATTLPSLIISDVMMPRMDGFQLLDHLKGSDAYRLIPVIMLTARADRADKLRALRIGVDDYLLKPFDEDELLARITSLLLNQKERQKHVLTEADTPTHSEEVPAPTASAEDMAWLLKLEAATLAQLGNADLTAEWLADDMAVSRRTLFREIKRLTGLTPTQYITTARFRHARQLLENREVTSIKQLASVVGFRQIKHFSISYKNQFGKSPSDYL
ncbi:ATP-binding protein [Telluribacter sp.]|uniref:ATP-binding protein n=1 Tax=Telluribacter sp. TaxID=1978767 RepID=UPI002E114572|nr:ATP-binding protein [Telluribacter sp.]